MRKQILFLFIAGLLLVSACTGGLPAETEETQVFTPTETSAAQTEETTVEPVPTDTQVPPTPMDGGDPTPEAAKAARRALADLLGIGENEITINSIEQTTWPDACLGVGQPDESCLMVQTPGFIVNMTAAGMIYIYHTNSDGTTVRPAGTQPIPFQPFDAAGAAGVTAVRFLAGELNLPEENISVTGIVETQWPDACLGLPGKEELCAMVITPGFLIQLQAAEQTCFVHIDREATNVRYICGSEGSAADERLAADAAMLFLSQELEIPPSEMAITSIEAVDWPDGCLGISRPNISCLTVITPGYRIMMEAGGEQYEVRTNRSGSVVDLPPGQ
ncbi:MAG: hypothetical protein EHM41_23220 [Chloroflexi bacterium]|nr:MAG: hypothetical protein EHM41_23220 [Chloroflexota bacterium]